MVNKLSQFMYAPSEMHWGIVKLLLRYLNGSRDFDICLLTDTPLTLHGFSDMDCAGDLDDQCSISAEYRAITSVTSEFQWIKSLLTELLLLVITHVMLFTDNLGVTYLSVNSVFHSQMKHLVIDYHFVHDLV
ncbi:hypothetical protein ZIOFF_046904 [Zingiber officinale]|uniref:Uncharacterized protein n=1 Tax=Zingiber officinale TaxID=94328 RepID=A0A8J5FWA8_ZINOF|nr:hypothetical protein ZIOFF_046904 [Zingiber officinale]